MLLDALRQQNKGRPPVWIMRQAGRYLPEYRRIREKHSLRHLFLTPELAAEITLLPIDLIKVDAAILFADITLIALALGLKLDFNEGPVIEGKVEMQDVSQTLKPVFEAIRLVKERSKTPLIGFCGGPFTVASYITPKPDHRLLGQITDASVDYLRLQVEAGVDAIQIFDSFAHTLSKEEYHDLCMPYLKKLVDSVSVPVILFMKETHTRMNELISLKPDAISFDWQRPLSEMRKQVPMAVQGNLDPDLLYQPLPIIRSKTKELLSSMEGDPGFIVNLGHGLKPDMSVDAVRCFVDTVRDW